MRSLNGFTLIDFSDGLFTNSNKIFSNSDEIQAMENWKFVITLLISNLCKKYEQVDRWMDKNFCSFSLKAALRNFYLGNIFVRPR